MSSVCKTICDNCGKEPDLKCGGMHRWASVNIHHSEPDVRALLEIYGRDYCPDCWEKMLKAVKR